MFKLNHEGIKIHAHFDNAVENEFNIIKIANLTETHGLIRIEQIDVAPLGLGEAEELCASYDQEAAFWEKYSWVGGVPKSESDIIKILRNEKIIKAAA